MRLPCPIGVSLAALAAIGAAASPGVGDTVDSGATHYSQLTQITPANVNRLVRAWVYHTGEKGRQFESVPLLAGGLLYFTSQSSRVIALEPETGKEVWEYDPHVARARENRGVSYWPGEGRWPPRILHATGDGRLIALNAKTGKLEAEFGDNGSETALSQTDFNPYPPLDWAGFKQVPNVRRHWEIRISRHQAEVLINGQTVMKTAADAFNLTQDHYYLLWNVFSYNSDKANVPFVLAHWDNFGFDAPVGTTHNTVTHNYRLVNTGSDFMKTFGDQATTQATLNIPDTVDGAAARRLMFTLQMDQDDTYEWAASDTVSVNGTAFPIPKPVSNAQPTLSPQDIVNIYSPYTEIIDLPTGTLKQGANTISFNTVGSSLHNIHAELDFRAPGPDYTQPALAIGGALTPAIPAVGPNAVMTKIAAATIDNTVEKLNDPAVFNPAVNGIVPIGVEVHEDIALQGTGSNVGVRQIELLIDKNVVLTQRTDAEAAAPSVITTLNLDTRSLSNGTHEIFLRAYDTRCTPSIADYHEAGATSGEYFPLHIKVQNSAAAVAAAPSQTNHVFLPIAMLFSASTLPVTCALTAAQAANRSSGAPSTPWQIGAAPRDAVRDDQRLLICDL